MDESSNLSLLMIASAVTNAGGLLIYRQKQGREKGERADSRWPGQEGRLYPGLCSKPAGFMLPSVTPSPKYSQVVMAMNLKDEHTEHRTPFFFFSTQTTDSGYAVCPNKHPEIIFLGTDEVRVPSSSTKASIE